MILKIKNAIIRYHQKSNREVLKMKEKISLVLAIVMVIGALAGLSAFAEAGVETAPETEVSYDGLKIAYSNINYTDELYMMFAVPVIADLPATHKIQLLTCEENAVSYSVIIFPSANSDA